MQPASTSAASAPVGSHSWKSARCLRMEERVVADPLDADAWEMLLNEAQKQTPADYRPLFERCMQHFPSAAICWYYWITTELQARDVAQVESLFERCLLLCQHMELWSMYVRYLKQEKRAGPKELVPALKLLLDTVGADVKSGPLWLEYIGLLRDQVEPGAMPTAASVTAVREVYQRALVQPAIGLEALWKEYEAWEAVQSRDNAKAVLAEVADEALVARRVARERKVLVDQLELKMMPRRPRGTQRESTQLRAWRALWEYEASNPQRLPPDELQGRMRYTFNQALMVSWFTPQVRACARDACARERESARGIAVGGGGSGCSSRSSSHSSTLVAVTSHTRHAMRM